jgi:hydrogenase maturation protease
VIGLGQRYGGDDAVGLAVVARLRALGCPDGVELVEAPDAAHLVAALETPGRAIIVDALLGPGEPGRIHVITPGDLDAGGLSAVSTHGLDVPGAIALAAALYPSRARAVHIVGVEIARATRFREGMSPEVAAAVDGAVAAVLALA